MIGNQLIDAVTSLDYEKANQIVEDDWFDPNFTVMPSGMPIATYILEMSGSIHKNSLEEHKKLITKIVRLPQFNPNKRLDTFSGETMLMRIAKNPEYNWLIDEILHNRKLNIFEEDYGGNTALMTAVSYDNRECERRIMDFIGRGKDDDRSMMPKKKKATMTTLPNGEFINRVETGFNDGEKIGDNTLYSLIKNFMWQKYDKCIDIIKSSDFNFNSTDRWGEPSFHSVIYFANLPGVKYDEDGFKKVAEAFMSRADFDVNALDCDCNTIPMVTASIPRMKWLLELLISKCHNIDMSIRNDVGMTLEEIATRNGISIFASSN